MSEHKLAGILRQQVPDREKRHRADFVVQTGAGRAGVLKDLKKILKGLK
jgi:dephospho-CoA kinase